MRQDLICIFLPSLPDTPVYKDNATFELPIRTNDTYRIGGSEEMYLSVPEETRAQVRAGTLTFFMWGFVEYEDLTRKPHKTRFVYEMRYRDRYPDGGKLFPVREALAYWEHS